VTFSTFQRNPLLLDGGDNLAYLVLLYLVLCSLPGCGWIDARTTAAEIVQRSDGRRVGKVVPLPGEAVDEVAQVVHDLATLDAHVFADKWLDDLSA
jgi:hypothetical protein